MKKDIQKFIIRNKRSIDSETLALSLGGILLAILLLTGNSNSPIPDNSSSNLLSTNLVESEINKKDVSNFDFKDDIKEQEVTIYRENGDVISLPLEEYVTGVVGAEMPASFPVEALKAQAIVARTYALKKIQEGKKITDTVSTQGYKDNEELKKLWNSSYEVYYQKVKEAVEATKGLVLCYEDELIDALYHSTSNGKTEDSMYVWGNEIPYLKSVDSSWDIQASSYLKEEMKDYLVVLKLLGIQDKKSSIEILSKDTSGRVLEVKVGNQIFSGAEFRNLLGLRSTDFDLSMENEKLVITTRGYGHGVGMSQYGASGMAKEGYSYEQILKHYYTKVSIQES